MALPFKKYPRVKDDPRSEKFYGLSSDEKLEDYCIDELMEAVSKKDVIVFMKALEALLLNCFEMEDAEDE